MADQITDPTEWLGHAQRLHTRSLGLRRAHRKAKAEATTDQDHERVYVIGDEANHAQVDALLYALLGIGYALAEAARR